jgi:hypothetical protein
MPMVPVMAALKAPLHMTWKMGKIDSASWGVPAPGYGLGFSITNEHGAPLMTFGFEGRVDAIEAEKLVRAALVKIVNIMVARR